jgi:hypothetical protein
VRHVLSLPHHAPTPRVSAVAALSLVISAAVRTWVRSDLCLVARPRPHSRAPAHAATLIRNLCRRVFTTLARDLRRRPHLGQVRSTFGGPSPSSSSSSRQRLLLHPHPRPRVLCASRPLLHPRRHRANSRPLQPQVREKEEDPSPSSSARPRPRSSTISAAASSPPSLVISVAVHTWVKSDLRLVARPRPHPLPHANARFFIPAHAHAFSAPVARFFILTATAPTVTHFNPRSARRRRTPRELQQLRARPSSSAPATLTGGYPSLWPPRVGSRSSAVGPRPRRLA